MKMNFKYHNIDSQDLLPKKQKMLKQLGLPISIRVPIRMRGLSSTGTPSLCHNNVTKMVKRYGGKRLVGHTIESHKGGLEVFDHSVWITPENKVVCITKGNYSKEIIKKGYIVFQPREIDASPDTLLKNSYYDFVVRGKSVVFVNNKRTSRPMKLKHAGKFMEDTYKMDLGMSIKKCDFLECA
jgi:hypothetical protein